MVESLTSHHRITVDEYYDYSQPEPDLVVMRPRVGRNDRGHPSAADVLLIVEISNSKLRYDLDIKVPLYARHGVPEVWVIDLKHHKLHLYRSPVEGSYQYVPLCRTPASPPFLASAPPRLTCRRS